MKGKQLIYLFIALLLPGCIFIFLKIFGKNEFAVQPLYQTETPTIPNGCTAVTIPYLIPDTVFRQIFPGNDSLSIIIFDDLSAEGKTQWERVGESFPTDPIHNIQLKEKDEKARQWRSCIFFLKEPFNLVLVDNHRRIRGEYDVNDREDVDRLLTEITIILRKY
jgi:hypothetical protein